MSNVDSTNNCSLLYYSYDFHNTMNEFPNLLLLPHNCKKTTSGNFAQHAVHALLLRHWS